MARLNWWIVAPTIDPARLVFLDETFGTTAMTRLCGWEPTSERVLDAVPHGHWKTTPFVAAFRLDGLFAPLVVDGVVNGALFAKYIRQEVAPHLRSGDILVMDNLRTHKVKGSPNNPERARPVAGSGAAHRRSYTRLLRG